MRSLKGHGDLGPTFCFLILVLSARDGFGEDQKVTLDSNGDNSVKFVKDCTRKDEGLGVAAGDDGCLADDEMEVLTIEQDGNESTNRSEGRSGRRRRAVEDDFEGTVDMEHLSDIYDPHKLAYNTHSIVTGGGYATNDRTHLLRFEVGDDFLHYPPFTYRGFFHKKEWHKISIQTFLKKRNKSFMLLDHECEGEPARVQEKECIKKKYGILPNCSAFDQSPININLTKARDSSLKEFIYENLFVNNEPVGFDFVMSFPFDGTDMLTVELLTADPNDATAFAGSLPSPPSISKGSIVGKDLYLERIHIKYGTTEDKGSEHFMNGTQYGMELQFIFTKNGRNKREQYWDILFNYYTTPSGIEERRKAVHLIAILVEVISDDELKRTNANDTHYNKKASEAFEILSNAARMFWRINNVPIPTAIPVPTAPGPPGVPVPPTPPQITWKHRAFKTKDDSPKLKLGDILPPLLARNQKYSADHSIYYNYKGSITHPPCFAYVDWAVYDKPLKISKTMWQNFLYIPSEFDDTKFVAGNFRSPKDVYVLGLDKTLNKKDQINQTQMQIRARDLRKSKRSRNSSEPNFKNIEDDYSDDDLNLGIRIRMTKVLALFLSICLFRSLAWY